MAPWLRSQVKFSEIQGATSSELIDSSQLAKCSGSTKTRCLYFHTVDEAKTNAKNNEQNENDWEHVSAKILRDEARNMPINYITFNQDNSILGLATSRGLRQYTTEPFALCYQDEEGDIALMEMLFTTRLVAVVLSPRVLRVINTKRSATICELSFPLKILAVKLNRKRLAVVLDNQIYLYDISNMKLLHTIDTSPNPHGLCTLSPSSENNFMVFPLPQKESTQSYSQPAHRPPSGSFLPPQTGEALVFDADKLEAVNVIRAHQSALGCIAVNGDGTLLATASEKGTVIRVFSIPGGEKLFHFRRGSLPTQIFCMSFNPMSTLLSVSSATETVHIFKLVAQTKESAGSGPPSPVSPKSAGKQRHISIGSRDRSTSPASDELMDSHEIKESATGTDKKPQPQSLMSMIRRTSQSVGLSIAQRAGEYLPSSVTEMFEPARDFAWVRVPRQSKPATNNWPVRSVVAMSANHPQLMVVTSEGQFYVFNVDLENGGEGVLEHQYPLNRQRSISANADDF